MYTPTETRYIESGQLTYSKLLSIVNATERSGGARCGGLATLYTSDKIRQARKIMISAVVYVRKGKPKTS